MEDIFLFMKDKHCLKIQEDGVRFYCLRNNRYRNNNIEILLEASLHNINGPSIILSDGFCYYHVNNEFLRQNTQNERQI